MSQINLPEYFKIKLGNSEYELDTETLITSLSHQYLSKTSNQNSFEHYDVLFSLIKDEIKEYLSKTENKFIDLFGDWSEDFKNFHNAKNEPICKDIVFNFSDGSKWSIKILDLLTLREDFNAMRINYEDPILKDDTLLFDWILTLDWDDVSELAEEIERPKPEPDYVNEWKACNKEVVLWENQSNILDFFEVDDTIGLEEMPDGRPI